MAVVNKTRTYGPSDQLTNVYYNQDRDEVIAGVNSVVDAQVAVGAAIQESKIAFNSGGHGHTGGTDGKKIEITSSLDLSGLTPNQLIKVNSAGTALESTTNPSNQQRGYVWYIGTDLAVGNDVSVNPPITMPLTATGIRAYIKTPSVGANIIINIKYTDGTLIGTLTIPAGQNSAVTTSLVAPVLINGNFLRLDVTQIGISTVGSKLTVMLETTT